MNTKTNVVICLVALFLIGVVLSDVHAQQYKREPDFADEVDSVFTRAGKLHNRQKFFSILLFVVLGGACTYAQLRGIKKVVSSD